MKFSELKTGQKALVILLVVVAIFVSYQAATVATNYVSAQKETMAEQSDLESKVNAVVTAGLAIPAPHKMPTFDKNIDENHPLGKVYKGLQTLREIGFFKNPAVNQDALTRAAETLKEGASGIIWWYWSDPVWQNNAPPHSSNGQQVNWDWETAKREKLKNAAQELYDAADEILA